MKNLKLDKIINKSIKLPNSPGVYLFQSKNKKPIYIGRAGSLKKRVASYFLKNTGTKAKDIVSESKFFSIIKTETVLESVVLEANLIKKHWPKYNVRDKDNRSFVYLVISQDEYPRPIIVRGREVEKYLPNYKYIYGPYQSYHSLKTTLKLLRRIFPYCTKANMTISLLNSVSLKPCFYYQIGLCPGACIGSINVKEYKKDIRSLRLFYSGEKKQLMKKLKNENPDKIKALKHVEDIALITPSKILSESINGDLQRIEGYDISQLSKKNPVGSMVVFANGTADTSQYRLFNIKKFGADVHMLQEVLIRRLKHKEWPYPNLIVVDGGLAQVRSMREILKVHKLSIPLVGIIKKAGHSASSNTKDKLVINGAMKSSKDLIMQNKKLFQQIRNEAHRFAISHMRKRSKNTPK